jgi:hypothetical protein
VSMGVRANEREGHGGAAQDPPRCREGSLRPPRRVEGPGRSPSGEPKRWWKRSRFRSPQARQNPSTKGAPAPPLTSGQGGRGRGPCPAAAVAAVPHAAGP